jgi:hypothetical protein
MKAGMIWDEVERAGLSGVAGVWVHEFGGARMFNVVAIKQAYPGHARQAGLLAAGCQSGSYLGRFVVVVDDDVDPTDLFDVMWAMCTRCDPRKRHRVCAPRLERAARSFARQGKLDQFARHHRCLSAARAACGFSHGRTRKPGVAAEGQGKIRRSPRQDRMRLIRIPRRIPCE